MAVNGSGRLRRWFVQGIRGGARAAGHTRAQESRRLARENPPLGQTGKMRVCSPWLAVPPAAPMADSVDGHGARSVAGPDAKITRPNRRKQDCRTMVRSRDFGAAPPTENGCFNRAQVRAAKRPAACAERVPGCGVSSPGGQQLKSLLEAGSLGCRGAGFELSYGSAPIPAATNCNNALLSTSMTTLTRLLAPS